MADSNLAFPSTLTKPTICSLGRGVPHLAVRIVARASQPPALPPDHPTARIEHGAHNEPRVGWKARGYGPFSYQFNPRRTRRVPKPPTSRSDDEEHETKPMQVNVVYLAWIESRVQLQRREMQSLRAGISLVVLVEMYTAAKTHFPQPRRLIGWHTATSSPARLASTRVIEEETRQIEVNAAYLRWSCSRTMNQRRELHRLRAALPTALFVEQLHATTRLPPPKLIGWHAAPSASKRAPSRMRIPLEPPVPLVLLVLAAVVASIAVLLAVHRRTHAQLLEAQTTPKAPGKHADAQAWPLEPESTRAYPTEVLAQLCGLELHLLPPPAGAHADSLPHHCRLLHLRLHAHPNRRS